MYQRPVPGKLSANGVKNGVSMIFVQFCSRVIVETDLRDPLPGNIMSIKIFGQPIIIISSAKVVEDLLEKRSTVYSNRPVLTFAGEIVGWSNCIALLQCDHRFREFRKYMNRLIGTKAAMEKFDPLMEHETAKFLARIMADPGSFSQQIRM